MLTIGEFSNICRVSTKTLRYYAEIGLILPDEINPKMATGIILSTNWRECC